MPIWQQTPIDCSNISACDRTVKTYTVVVRTCHRPMEKEMSESELQTPIGEELLCVVCLLLYTPS